MCIELNWLRFISGFFYLTSFGLLSTQTTRILNSTLNGALMRGRAVSERERESNGRPQQQ